jgi:hypothetical protein
MGPGRDASGGGTFTDSGFLQITDCTIAGNAALGRKAGYDRGIYGGPFAGGNAYGGGLYVEGTAVSLTNVTIAGNQAVGGTGGLGNPFMTLIAGSGGSAAGGGLMVASGMVGLANATFSGNSTAGGRGGSLANESYTEEYTDTEISGDGYGMVVIHGVVTTELFPDGNYNGRGGTALVGAQTSRAEP